MPKIAKRLTSWEVENAPIKEQDYRLYDGEGLLLLVRKTGSKVWHYPYKFKGRYTTYTIGQYHKNRPGAVSLKKARAIRHEIRSLLAQGIDPNEHKKAQDEDTDTTFQALGREWHSKGVWVKKHAKNILRSLEDDVFPIIGNKQITDISRQDIIVVLEKVEERGAYDVAKRICQRCEAIFDYAITKGVCEDNPALGRAKFIQKPKRKNRPHFKENQLPEFLNKLESYHGRDYIKIALQLLVITFVRPGELRYARWEEVDELKAVWRIPAQRMKMDRDHIVPLSNQALLLIEQLRAITGHAEMLFPSVKNNQRPISDVTLTKVLRNLGYTGEQVVPHGFRHTASTILNEHSFNRDHVEKQLAHKGKDRVRSVYNHAEYLEDRKKMMQWYPDHLEALQNRGKHEKRGKLFSGTSEDIRERELS
jgi:integrase